jgi:zinc transport system substrate-binding protein
VRLYQLVILTALIISGCGQPVKNDTMVVATNSWTAAFAKAAGAKNVVVLAPFEMAHPAEYELRPSDIPLIVHAKVIIFAGYETMVKRLQSGLELKPEVLVKIDTDYSMATIEKSVMDIAQRLGTEKTALQNIDSIRHLLLEGRARFDKSGLNGARVLVNFFQQSIVKEMGFAVAGVFGPASLEAGDIDKMAKTGSTMIIDNQHNPVGLALAKVTTRAVYRQLLNFPGMNQTVTLLDVIRFNIRQLESAGENINQ